jgi:hypothetical protein
MKQPIAATAPTSAATTRGEESKERIARWRRMAVTIARQYPHWSVVEIAIKIQRSAAGRKRDGVLTYSLDNIARNIRGAVNARRNSD